MKNKEKRHMEDLAPSFYFLEKTSEYLAITSVKLMWGRKGGSMESNLTGWSDHKFLTGQVMEGSQLQAFNFFSESLIFA